MTRINDDFEAQEVTMFMLTRNGRQIVDEHGKPRYFRSLVEATDVAVNWHLHQAPTYRQLRALTTEELIEMMDKRR